MSVLQFGNQLHLPLKLLDEGSLFGVRWGKGFDCHYAARRRANALVYRVLGLMDEFGHLVLADGFSD
jgi:hypothetical protein